MLKKVTRGLLNRYGYDVVKIPAERGLSLYHEIYGRKAVDQRRFYNIGAGGFRHPAWTNIDKLSDWYKQAQGKSVAIDWDLLALTAIPVESDCAEVVYSSHAVEHVPDEAAANMFREAFRILKKAGVLRITMPNIDLHYRAYKVNDKHYFYWTSRYSNPKYYTKINLNAPLNQASIQQIFLWTFAASASTLHNDGSPERITDRQLDALFREKPYEEALNYCTSKCLLEVQHKYPGNHINWWNRDKTMRMLQEAGFSDVRLSAYGQSFCPVLRDTLLFDSTHPRVSLYVEAVKT
jgi:SAM-dependent methyltransferase